MWFVTIEDHRLILFGHKLVGGVMSQSEAEAALGTKDLWKAKYHIVPKGGPEPFDELPIAHIARDLRFQGNVAQLPHSYSGQNLQTIRLLRSGSAVIVRRACNKTLK